jgi:hypothetical protein
MNPKRASSRHPVYFWRKRKIKRKEKESDPSRTENENDYENDPRLAEAD